MAVVASGAIGASAATSSTSEGDTFTGNIAFLSNAPLSFITVSDIPQSAKTITTSNVITDFLVVDTDGSGKIEGTGFLEIQYGIPTLDTNGVVIGFAATGFSDYIIDVSGKISTKGSNPNVQESIKGKGYSTTSSNLNTIVNPTSASSSLSVSFTANSAVVGSNSTIAGNLKGSVKPGKVPGVADGTGKSVKVDETAILAVDNFQITDMPVQVVQFQKKFDAVALLESEGIFAALRGSGSVNSSKNTYTANFKGVGQSRGASFKLDGSTGPLAIIIGGETNTVTTVNSVHLKGKLVGQTVDVSGAALRQLEF